MRYYVYGTILEERPDLVEYIVDKENATKYHIGSAQKIDWICPNCGNVVKSKSINKVVSRGVPCKVCGDGVSKPEKIVSSALRQSEIEFEIHKIFPWSNGRVYDFYIQEANLIIEVNGSQHYGLGFKNLSGLSYEKQLEIDKQKHKMAIDNGILHYVIIEAIDTSAKHIIPQLVKELEPIGVKINADITKCEYDSLESNVIKAADLWNKGLLTGEISKHIGVKTGTTIKYLKLAKDLGLCDYTPQKAHKMSQMNAVEHRKRKVKCETTGEIFDSLASACRKYNISNASSIIECCKLNTRSAGKYNGVPLSWSYI